MLNFSIKFVDNNYNDYPIINNISCEGSDYNDIAPILSAIYSKFKHEYDKEILFQLLNFIAELIISNRFKYFYVDRTPSIPCTLEKQFICLDKNLNFLFLDNVVINVTKVEK